MSKKEVEKEVSKINISYKSCSESLGYCPLIKDRCNPKCICFKEAYAVLSSVAREFVVVQPRCSYKLFNQKEPPPPLLF